MWQKCPVCGGSGKTGVFMPNLSNDWNDVCNTCNGTGIINEQTGYPPAETTLTSASSELTDEKRMMMAELREKYSGRLRVKTYEEAELEAKRRALDALGNKINENNE